MYGAFDTSSFELTQEDINLPEGQYIKLNNNNFYLNGSYSGVLSDTWSVQTGFSFTNAKNKIKFGERDIRDTEKSLHSKLKFKNRISNRFKLYFGAEYFKTAGSEQTLLTLSRTLFVEEMGSTTINTALTFVDSLFFAL